jgi:hypothetical protein
LSARPELRAPKEDGAILAEPPLESAGALIAHNRKLLHSSSGEPADQTRAEALSAYARLSTDLAQSAGGFYSSQAWAYLRREARRDTLGAARRYVSDSGEPVPRTKGADSFIVAGHQPELFHPGVWAKNFALSGLARRHDAVALNIVVDNDTVKSTSLRVPSPGTAGMKWSHTVTVPFDCWTGEIPYEERPILDRDAFDSFGERAGHVLSGWNYEPLLKSFWPEVLRQAERTPLLGECMAAARRAFERRWGCNNLEIPVSVLCRTAAFQRFAWHLLSELPRFLSIYNDCVHDYRRRYGIRSRNHPVPDLVVDGDWLETPFWGWRAGQQRRGRLFARVRHGAIDLRAGTENWPSVPAVEEWWTDGLLHDLEGEGYKIRSRALSNTLYARLFLGDLFVHGIGGGKYDELTDAIIRRFYGIEPPAFVVLTATRLLPLPHYPSGPDDRHRLQRALRDIHWNPQRHFSETAGDIRDLAREKYDWMQRQPADKAGRRERFRMLRELTARLRAPLASAEHRLRDELAESERQVEANAVLTRRDYSFVLYPEETLRPFCEQFL